MLKKCQKVITLIYYNNLIGNKIKREKIDIPHAYGKGNKNNIFYQKKEYENNSINYSLIKDRVKKDHLEEGIGTYIYKKQFKKINPADFINKSIYNKIQFENKNFNITQRVINPEKNKIKEKPNNKRFFSQEKNLRHTTDGTYRSLINRTPVVFPIKGRKILNKSLESHDIFLRDINNINEDKAVRLFGVERKYITKNHNAESELPKYKFQRKHFFNKEVKTSLY